MDRIQWMWENDHLVRDFGMTLLEAREGYARVSVVVQERFLNALGMGHGALLFAVADAAFAVSVNAVVDAVAVQWSLNALRPARQGDELIGESRVVHAGRRMTVCELAITTTDGRVLVRGQATAMPAEAPRRECEGASATVP